MNTSGNSPVSTQTARAVRAWVDSGKIWVELDDGREVGFPASKYRRLQDADEGLLAKVRIEARGRARRWEELDEDLSIEGILAGRWLP